MATIEADPKARGFVKLWIGTMLILFVVLILLGVTMRLGQASILGLDPGLFYAMMTMHGLGMAGVLYSAGFAGLWLLISGTTKLHLGVFKVAFVLIVLGAVGLVVATLIGRFGPGWYVLYPLPFVNPAWPSWATGTAIISLMLLGVGWLISQLDMLRGLAARYGLRRMFGWHWFSGDEGEDVPIVVLIATVVALAGALATICGAAMLMMYLLQWFNPALKFDPLLMKNMVFMFGHTIVNIAMYCGVAFVYAFLPSFTGRPWKGNKVVAISWNATLLIVLFAYFHHLYMDFNQPGWVQHLGQIASYSSAIPATAITGLGVIGQLWRADTRWSMVPIALVAGIVGWIVGGFAAVVDATIAFNTMLHNTLWVPGHFHTYFLVGFVVLLIAFVEILHEREGEPGALGAVATMLLGGYGFVMAFYLGGVNSVPRRFATYDNLSFSSLADTGRSLAGFGAVFATVFLSGLLAYLALTWAKRRSAVA